jgi:alpha-glucuronidase
MDRTVATGTGYAGQYRPAVAKVFESLATTPDELITWFHHVPYTYKLHNGKTVIQYIYDSHYEGAEAVEQYASDFKSLASHMDERRYNEILAQLEYQAGQATVWRDAVNNWFHRASNIPDAKNRVGRNLERTEAEEMKLDGYTTMKPIRWESASGGEAVECKQARCEASLAYMGIAGWRRLRVQYFDQNNGQAHYRVRINDQVVDEWTANFVVPTARLDSSSSSRRTIANIALRPGDIIDIEGTPNAGELAGFDYIEILPE